MDEFELIARFFARDAARAPVLLGIGDDAALLDCGRGKAAALACDTLVSGRHFAADADPASVGHKALAVNLSDLAAMGAEPAAFLLALTLPEADADWLERFAAGLHDCARRYGVQLAGGDTTRGPLTVTVTAVGFVPPGAALRRDGARADDAVCVTGTLGDAAAAYSGAGNRESGTVPPELLSRLHWPEPRIQAGLALRGLASAAIDVSDGLMADLGHICLASGVGADIDAETLPASAALRSRFPTPDSRFPLQAAGGDDYELAVTVPAKRVDEAIQACAEANTPLHVIGRCTEGEGVRLRRPDGTLIALPETGYRHFADN